MYLLNKKNHILECLRVAIEEELILQEVCIVTQLQGRVPRGQSQLAQARLRVGCQQLLGQHVAAATYINDEEV